MTSSAHVGAEISVVSMLKPIRDHDIVWIISLPSALKISVEGIPP